MRRFLDTPSAVWLRTIAETEADSFSVPPADVVELWPVQEAAREAIDTRRAVEADRHTFGPAALEAAQVTAARVNAEYAAWLLTVPHVLELDAVPLEAAATAIARAQSECESLDLDRNAGLVSWVIGLHSEIALRRRAPQRALDLATQREQIIHRPALAPDTIAHTLAWRAAMLEQTQAFRAATELAHEIDLDAATPAVGAYALSLLVKGPAEHQLPADRLIRALKTYIDHIDLVPHHTFRASPVEVLRNLAAIARDLERRIAPDTMLGCRVAQARWRALAHTATARWRELAEAIPVAPPPVVDIEVDVHGRVTDASQHAIRGLIHDLEPAATALTTYGYAIPTRTALAPDAGIGGADLGTTGLVTFDPLPDAWRPHPDPGRDPGRLGTMIVDRQGLALLADFQRRQSVEKPPTLDR